MEGTTAETGDDYLNNTNFRALIEWVTAECLMSRPADPVVFMRAILGKKLGERTSGEEYNPEHASKYIKQCYAEAR